MKTQTTDKRYTTKEPEEYEGQVTKDFEKHERQTIKDKGVNNSDTGIADVTDKANNKTDKICKNSNNCDW